MLSAIFISAATLAAQTTPAPQSPADHPLARHYRDGETVTYRMIATNDDWHYTVLATSVVQRNPNGVFIENVQWSGMTSNGQPVTLAPGSADFRQPISLDTSVNPSGPNLSHVDPRLVGPITDLMTFYVDLWLANKIGIFQHAGDHFYVPNPQPGSWADGTRVLTGEDLIDFDVTLQSIDPAAHTAMLVVHHVPPPHSNLPLAAAWMQTPVADTPNNWVEVTKTQDGKYQAGVGKETFDVQLTVSTIDGKILSATMDNPVITSSRTCDDAALTHCTAPEPHTIHRHVEIALIQSLIPRLYRHIGVVGDGGDFCLVHGARSGRYPAYLSDERQRNEQKAPRPAGLGAKNALGRPSRRLLFAPNAGRPYMSIQPSL